MNKRNIINLILKNKHTGPLEVNDSAKEDNHEDDNIVEAIKDALQEIESARNFFQTASDPKLVDYAIYLEAAAQSRYTYLIHQAKLKGITVDVGSMLTEVKVI